MIKVYYDKNVLSHIISSRRGREAAETYGVTTDDVEALRGATAAGRIVGLLSEMHLQEAAYALRAQTSDAARHELQLIRDLMDTGRIVKDPKTLLTDDIVSYARGDAPSSPLIPNPHDLEWVLTPGASDAAGHVKALDDTDKQNAEFIAKGKVADAHDRPIISGEFGTQPKFEEFYERKIRQRIVGLVKRAEEEKGMGGLLAACEERGIEGLLGIRSVALAAGISLSYEYAMLFGQLKRGKKHNRKGDPPDLTHALLASAADILVTHDQGFEDWVSRIPNKGYEVLGHVHKLVERVG